MTPAFMLGVWSAILFAAACFTAARVFGQFVGQLRSVPAPVVQPLMIEEEAMQLSFVEAMEAKNEVLDDLIERHTGWYALALAKYREVQHQLPSEFIGEDIRDLLLKSGLPKPKSPNVWGGFVRYIGNKRLIIPTGAWRAMQAEGSNARQSRVYGRAQQRELV